MGKYGLLTTYSNTLCNERGEQFVCNSFGNANRLRLSINADIERLEAERDALKNEVNGCEVLVHFGEQARLKAEAELTTLRAKLDAVMAMLEDETGTEPIAYTYPEDPRLLRWQSLNDVLKQARAIVEGE